MRGLESNLGKALRLADGAGFHGDPATSAPSTEAPVGHRRRRQARREQYLTEGRVVLSIVPMGKLDQASKPGESKKVSEDAAAASGEEVRR